MAEIITLADMRLKGAVAVPLTEQQETFIRENCNKLSYKDLNAETGINTTRMQKILKDWGLLKVQVKSKPKPILCSEFFDVNELANWI